ncbi:MAG: 4-hydroxy-tetrahydrodipicolinate synthase [Marinilabiliales bacterium]|nr:MAG: 4-hydroxy-tetrahydrodipicolinate synthase [Marinilabiliales bacterium]
MMHNRLTGTGTALITPFTHDGKVDYPALEKLIDYQTHNGIDFLVALGTTGESVTLTAEEKSKVISTFVNKKNGTPLVVGMGSNNTLALCDQIKNTDFTGIDAILSVVPYYNKPSQAGIYQHFAAVAEASPVPVILYNVPGRTGTNMSAETTLKLAGDFENIIAVKEASGDMSQIMDILRRKKDDFFLLSGDDALTFPMLGLGAEGVISVVANVFPAHFASMVINARGGNCDKAVEIHQALLPFIDMLFKAGSPAGVKEALSYLGFCDPSVRLPLAPISEELKNKINTFADHFSKTRI